MVKAPNPSPSERNPPVNELRKGVTPELRPHLEGRRLPLRLRQETRDDVEATQQSNAGTRRKTGGVDVLNALSA